jgi:hypothetical protein
MDGMGPTGDPPSTSMLEYIQDFVYFADVELLSLYGAEGSLVVKKVKLQPGVG